MNPQTAKYVSVLESNKIYSMCPACGLPSDCLGLGILHSDNLGSAERHVRNTLNKCKLQKIFLKSITNMAIDFENLMTQ